MGIRVETDKAAIFDLMRSPEIVAMLEKEAHRIANQLGSAYDVDLDTSTFPNGKTRANVSVYTTDPEAIARNLDGNEMLKALH